MEEKKKFKLHMPHVLTLIFFLIIVVAILTWILPSGEFERKVVETSAGERSVAVAGTYHSVDKVLEDGTNLRQGIAQVLMAPGKGIQQMVEVLAFVFIIGGVFQIMAKTNALNMGIQKIVKKLGAKEILIIPILMGYDSMTTFMTVCLSATVGYAASTVNPFCVLIAQGIAGIQGNPQLVFRMLQFAIMMALVIAFVTWRAFKIKKNPEKSITYQDDLIKKKEMNTDIDFNQEMTIRQKLVLLTFVIGMVIVVVGLVKNGWYMNELSMCFLGMGILMGIFGGMNETEIAEEFINGVKDIAFAAMVIGFCSGIMVIAQDGMIIDTILNALSGLVEKSNNVVFSAVMYVVQSLLTLLVPSSSGLAALSMPIMAPLCDLHGVNPEAAVTALQYGNQLTNLMSPVAGTTVAGLAICKISFGQWWKTIWKMFLIMAVIAIVFCTISAGL